MSDILDPLQIILAAQHNLDSADNPCFRLYLYIQHYYIRLNSPNNCPYC